MTPSVGSVPSGVQELTRAAEWLINRAEEPAASVARAYLAWLDACPVEDDAARPILAADLAGMLVFGGFIHPEAQDDPGGYDNYRTMEKVGYLANLLNARVAAHNAIAKAPGSAA